MIVVDEKKLRDAIIVRLCAKYAIEKIDGAVTDANEWIDRLIASCAVDMGEWRVKWVVLGAWHDKDGDAYLIYRQYNSKPSNVSLEKIHSIILVGPQDYTRESDEPPTGPRVFSPNEAATVKRVLACVNACAKGGE